MTELRPQCQECDADGTVVLYVLSTAEDQPLLSCPAHIHEVGFGAALLRAVDARIARREMSSEDGVR
ncbi:hypothetical protein [Streptomyces xiamenensis]|uniref:hypothetical protein n=1 Tax=Streptomyces xiamenensis TaxID=408015 RepID=UPI0037D88FAE